MAYSTTNPVRKILDFGIASAGSIWSYESTHAHAAIEAAGFFAGCGFGSPGSAAVGMRVGDLLININQSTAGTSAISMHRVTSISTSTGFNGPLNATVSVGSS
ncbi:hypothetical protein [Pseudogulbenkiania subflava]|uniref:Uncharacterized protein n=1 Tax=Pseudogulbenkiania subflava DSM 22618 TaxID=1123014 RepID=A0A1Y6BDD1_9NEIS|nr:hypothetical protein [Pseudogulbenkiania subflava]SMF04043.1 hypothetical protein SAMN02745746_00922 [Pseudogulbenkiania subflava DSM 22618]